MKKLYSNKLHILLFLLPALILFCGVLIAPIGASAYYSLYDWNGIGAKTFIGFSNYRELFTSNSIGFMRALRNALLLAALSVFLQLTYLSFLAVREDSGYDLIHPGCLTNRPGCTLIIACKHYDLHPQLFKLPDGARTVLLDHVRYCNDP